VPGSIRTGGVPGGSAVPHFGQIGLSSDSVISLLTATLGWWLEPSYLNQPNLRIICHDLCPWPCESPHLWPLEMPHSLIRRAARGRRRSAPGGHLSRRHGGRTPSPGRPRRGLDLRRPLRQARGQAASRDPGQEELRARLHLARRGRRGLPSGRGCGRNAAARKPSSKTS
jgi:hypothetical protein